MALNSLAGFTFLRKQGSIHLAIRVSKPPEMLPGSTGGLLILCAKRSLNGPDGNFADLKLRCKV